jgi:hypothetical protein
LPEIKDQRSGISGQLAISNIPLYLNRIDPTARAGNYLQDFNDSIDLEMSNSELQTSSKKTDL